jgi:ABC-type nitrate/sulfonate/bicarbonate transport system permease component
MDAMSHIGGVARSIVRNGWGIFLLVLAWEAWVIAMQLNSIVMPRPLGVLRDLAAAPEIYGKNAIYTVSAAIVGLALGMALGTSLAVIAWLSGLLEGLLTPLTVLFSSVPVVTIIPIIARLLGYDFATVLAIVVIICFFPAYVFTTSGLCALPAGSDDLFRVLGARTGARLFRLALPAALPNWSVALRVAAGQAVLGAMVAEYLMGTAGLGYLFAQTKSDFNMERAFGATLLATIVSVAFFLAALAAERAIKDRCN